MLASILSTLVNVNVPLAVPVLGGVFLALRMKMDSKPLLLVTLYVLIPALVFRTLTTAQISREDVVQTVLFSVLNMGALWGIAKLLSRMLRLSYKETAGMTLVATITNCVNYGLPLVLLAFGQAGMDKASVFVLIQIIFVNTGGVYLAARSHFSGLAALKAVFRLPAIYATVLALVFRATGLSLPTSLDTGISMVAAAYSPMALLVLGTQMAAVGADKVDLSSRRAFLTGLAIRMAIAPVVSWLVLLALGVDGLLRSVLIVEASMPVAVNAVILAEKFDAAPKVLSRCILWTTAASFAVIPILISLVRQ
jgi:predicted permease